jgi:hypothetical protein
MIGPLMGIACIGWVVQLAYYLDWPVGKSAVAAFVFSVFMIIVRREAFFAARWVLCRASALYLCCFLASLLALSWTVWPAAGPWSADWSSNLEQLTKLWRDQPLSGWSLARPSAFPAIAVPICLVFDTLPALQIAACTFAAAALVALLWIAEEFSDGDGLSASVLWLAGLSVFYLVNLTAIVPKFGQGVLIVSAFVLLKRHSHSQLRLRIAMSTILISLALEIHQSTAAYAIAYAALLWHVSQHRMPRFMGIVLMCAPALLIIVAMPELVRIVRFGLNQIIQFNPSVAMRSSKPAWLVYLLNIESTFVGWAYLLPFWNIVKVAHDGSWQTIAYYTNWIVMAHLGMMANTFLLIFLPFIFTWQRLRSAAAFVRCRLPPDIAVGLATVPLITALLHPYLIAQGLVHAGATALAVGGLALGMAWLGSTPGRFRASLLFTITVGTLWWLAWNAIQYLAVLQAGGYMQSGPRLEMDEDWRILIESGQMPWGYGDFPCLPLVLLCLTAICAALFSLQAKHAQAANVQARSEAAAALN